MLALNPLQQLLLPPPPWTDIFAESSLPVPTSACSIQTLNHLMPALDRGCCTACRLQVIPESHSLHLAAFCAARMVRLPQAEEESAATWGAEARCIYC